MRAGKRERVSGAFEFLLNHSVMHRGGELGGEVHFSESWFRVVV
jgi:hypothetical protein